MKRRLPSVIRDVSVSQGIAAFIVLIGLQFVISWLGSRFPSFHGVATGEPALLLRHGEMLHAELLRQRVSTKEVEAAARRAGLNAASEADAVILETDGSFSVVPSRNVLAERTQ